MINDILNYQGRIRINYFLRGTFNSPLPTGFITYLCQLTIERVDIQNQFKELPGVVELVSHLALRSLRSQWQLTIHCPENKKYNYVIIGMSY
jgi:hypothetical protein